MIKKISHIGIAVKNLNEVKTFYEQILGLKFEAVEEVKDQKAKLAMVTIGESRIEIMESIDTEGPIAKFIERRGEGLHHIALEVDNLEENLQKLKESGVRLVDEKPRFGARGIKIAFLHPKAPRVLLELCEVS